MEQTTHIYSSIGSVNEFAGARGLDPKSSETLRDFTQELTALKESIAPRLGSFASESSVQPVEV